MRRAVKEVGWVGADKIWSATHYVVVEMAEGGRSYTRAEVTLCGAEIQPNSGVFAMGPTCRECAAKLSALDKGAAL